MHMLYHRISKIVAHPLFSYACIALLQIKVVWGTWHLWDLGHGDSASYFAYASLWHKYLLTNFAYSPFYTACYGSLLFFFSDAYSAFVFQRLAIIFAVSLGGLAVMRRLMPAPLAWIAAAWWVIHPANFNVDYEVHLFAVLPFIAIWLLSLIKPGSLGRGWTLSILLATAVLVRNEIILSLIFYFFVCGILEMRAKATWDSKRLRQLTLHYGGPLALALAFIALFVWRNSFSMTYMQSAFEAKHTLNMCQMYGYGYSQRHPEWMKNPWTDCPQLMAQQFGSMNPTLTQMLHSNPGACLEHVLWNLRITPGGLQYLLLAGASWPIAPGHPPFIIPKSIASIATFCIILIWSAGLWIALKEGGRAVCAKVTANGMWAMLCFLPAAFAVIATQWPRADYLLPLCLMMIAGTMFLGGLLLEHLGLRLDNPCWIIIPVLVALVLAPPYDKYTPDTGRPLLTLYRRLAPFQRLLQSRSGALLVNGYPEFEIYIGSGASPPRVTYDYSLFKLRRPSEKLAEFLESQGIQIAYLDESLWPAIAERQDDLAFLRSPQDFGWQTLAGADQGQRHWHLFERVGARAK